MTAESPDRERRDPTITRRRFLAGGGLAIGAATLAACGVTPNPSISAMRLPAATGSPEGTATAPTDLSDPPFGLWLAMRDAVRRSPDHLPMAAAAAVASGDPKAIFAFVRDNIATVPSDPRAFYAATVTAVRWGIRATLRGGAGTARERAELLADLYRRAGFQARVMSGSSILGADDVRRAMTRPVRRAFEPPVPRDDVAAWIAATGLSPASPGAQVDPDGSETRALATALLAAIPAAGPLQAPDLHPLDMPFVEVIVDGTPTSADPFLPDAELGRSYVHGAAIPAADATSALPVHLELAVASALRPAERNVVLSADWTADQLVGRQVVLGFTPPGPLGTALTLAPRDLTIVTPTAIVQAIDLEAGLDPKLSVAGTAFTIGGELLTAAADGSVDVAGRTGAISAGDPGAAVRVADIEIRVDAGRFPMVEVDVTPRDAAGALIPGLGADELVLSEDGLERGYLLARDHVSPPRVLLLFDTSGSMPPGYSGPALAALGVALGDRIAASVPGVELAAATLFGTPAWTSDRSALAAQLDGLGLGGSDALWHGVVAAAALEPDVIILVTDGGATDEANAALRAAIASGPPVVGLSVVGAAGLPTLQQIATTSGGSAAPATQATAADRALDGISATMAATAPYRLRYHAVEAGPVQRTVSVSLRGSSVPAAVATYAVPAPAIRAVRRGLGRVELTLRVGDVTVTRVLAGSRATDVSAGVTPGQADEAWAALFGQVFVSFEGGDPSVGQLIDDVLTATLARRALAHAMAAGDETAVLGAFSDGYPELPPALVSLLGPIGGADGSSATFPTGLRVTLLRMGPRVGGGTAQHADILPFSRWTTIGPDPSQAHSLTVQRTARLAILERAAFLRSTASVLADAGLRPVEPNLPLSAGGSLDATSAAALDAIDDPAYRSDIRLVRADGRPDGYWAIDPETGSTWGVLPDGSGGGESAYDPAGNPDRGGVSSTANRLNQLSQAASGLKAAGAFAGGSIGLAGGAILVIGLAAARQYVRAASYLSVNPSDDPSTNAQEVENLVCNLGRLGAKEAIAGSVGLYGVRAGTTTSLKNADTYLGGAGINPFSC